MEKWYNNRRDFKVATGLDKLSEERKDRQNILEFFLKTVGYPEKVPEGEVFYLMRVDGMEVAAAESNGGIMLSYALDADDSMLPKLASYAAGRMLKEKAVFSYGDPAAGHGNSGKNTAFIWQDVPAGTDSHGMTRLFETFMDSCDWWRERTESLSGAGVSGGEVEVSETMVIRP